MSYQHYFAVEWCERAVTRDAGDGSVASTPRYDATRVADSVCDSPATRSYKKRPSLRWVTSGAPVVNLMADPDLKECAAVAVASCFRLRCSASLSGCCRPERGRVSPPWTAPALGGWSGAPASLAPHSSAAPVGWDPNALRIDLHGCIRVRNVCLGNGARRISRLSPYGRLRCEKIRSARIGKAQDDWSGWVGQVAI